MKNAFYAQSGGVTAVINASASGVIETARKYPNKIGKVYAGENGIIGALTENLIDTSLESDADIAALNHTPSGGFGSCRYKMKSLEANKVEYERLIEVFKAHNIGYFFYNGGGDSADTCLKVSQLSESMGYPIQAIHIPKTVDNDLPVTDNCPGFGSVAKYIAISTREASYDVSSMAKTSTKVFVIEVMGRDTGWLAYASALGKRSDADPPPVICIPEKPVSETKFLHLMETAYSNFGYAVAVVAENCRGDNGPLGASEDPWLVDGFGHEYYESPAKYLSSLLSTHLSVRVRHEHPGAIQRSFQAGLSTTDRNDAALVATAASDMAKQGASDGMVTLIRKSNDPYECGTGFVEIGQIANQVRRLPDEFINSDTLLPTSGFMSYAQPLIGDPLPVYVRI